MDLPLLVPSFSSKGFPYFEGKRGQQKHTYSEVTRALDQLGPLINESFLVSAFDLHHGHFDRPQRYFDNTALVFLDSGGYELNPEFDSTEPKITPTRQLPFSAADYDTTLNRLKRKHATTPLVLASFDWQARGQPFEEQIKEARKLFNRFRHWDSNFILKPTTPKGTVVHVDDLTPHLGELRTFSIIGVTEKELGKNLIDRLRRLAKLRVALTKRDVLAPIHVWGGLDPVVTPLYFFAGADVFDGVSWLRYAYHNGMAINREALGVLDGNITMSRDHSVMLALSRNLTALQGLANSLRAFATTEGCNFDMFDHQGDVFRKAFTTMMAKIPELKDLG